MRRLNCSGADFDRYALKGNPMTRAPRFPSVSLPARIISVLVPGLLILVIPFVGAAQAGVPWSPLPDWASDEIDDFGTGCDLGDLDGDGWLDLAVSNGNDMALAPNYVYLNTLGALPTSASWISDDELYSGHCELADLDSDGYPELMVTNYISPGWEPGSLQVYHNEDGTLETTPSWQAADPIYTFRATFGDPDGDGDLDLAVATGESYHGIFTPNLIFFNEGGTLATTPGWTSADSDAAYDVQFVDIDRDGDQDLAFLTSMGPVKIYYNENGTIATSPGWTSGASDNGNTFDFADLNGDGYLDLGVANNTQQSGSGYFTVYYSDAGVLSTTPDWSSDSFGYGSAVVFMDLDNDGDQDMVTGRWWGALCVYLNEGGGFATTPDWTSGGLTVVENIVFGDLDRAAETPMTRTFTGDQATRLLDLGCRHLQGVDRVIVDGEELPMTSWSSSNQAGWVSLADPPTDIVTVYFRHSRQKDMIVSNWDGATVMFSNDDPSSAPYDGLLPVARVEHRAYPNPFNPRLTIAYTLPREAQVKLDVFDVRGRHVASLVDEVQAAGERSSAWNAARLPSGAYFYRLRVDGQAVSGKVHLIK
jgi:hypothetical protein